MAREIFSVKKENAERLNNGDLIIVGDIRFLVCSAVVLKSDDIIHMASYCSIISLKSGDKLFKNAVKRVIDRNIIINKVNLIADKNPELKLKRYTSSDFTIIRKNDYDIYIEV